MNHKRVILLAILPMIAGCFTATMPKVAFWSVDYQQTNARSAQPSFGVARLSQITVRAPYDSRSMVVLRANGSIAFDGLNEFAALPSQLLKGIALDALAMSGRFAAVIPSASSVHNDCSVEILVFEQALDCRESDKRSAKVRLCIRVVDGVDRSIAAVGLGESEIDAQDGNYAQAFSRAYSTALETAIVNLK